MPPASIGSGSAGLLVGNILLVGPAEHSRKPATQVPSHRSHASLQEPEGDSVPNVLAARHLEVRSWPLSLASSGWSWAANAGQLRETLVGHAVNPSNAGVGLFPRCFGSHALMDGEQ